MERRKGKVPADFAKVLEDSGDGDTEPPAVPDGPIPKTVHFIYNGETEVTWIQWLAVRGAIAFLGSGEVKIWLDKTLEPKGTMWERITRMDEVTVNKVAMPTEVYGIEIPEPAQQSDVLRLKILYEEGGIFLENDLVPLKSSNEVLDDPETRSTVMAKRLDHESVPNWMIMAKPQAPFLKRLMLEYKSANQENAWQKLALRTALDLSKDDDDVTILDGHSWYFPLASEPNSDSTIKKLWFGKSWDDSEKSYGTHVWHWDEKSRRIINPHVVNQIDTPLFCRLRPLFTFLHGGEASAVAPEKNPNCTVTKVEDLETTNYRLFSDYLMEQDECDEKWVDYSGYNNHGWAPSGTKRAESHQVGAIRTIGAKSWAVLPVPSGWDAREWSARLQLKLDPNVLDVDNGFAIFKVRTDGDGEIVLGMIRKRAPMELMFDVDWRDYARRKQRGGDWIPGDFEEKWIPAEPLEALSNGFHELGITCDRRQKGQMTIYLDGSKIGSQQIPLLPAPDIGQDIWINSRDFEDLDLGFRGSVRRLTMYADVLPPEAMAKEVPQTSSNSLTSSFSTNFTHPEGYSFGFGRALFGILVLIMLTAFTVLRSRIFHMKEVLRYAREVVRSLRRSGNHYIPLENR